ncbi:protein yellow-like [Sitophilus oryzae]|uniref:Protein yellow-like n=1 Tax=Sitophilus oryzae TaxID=7048 RepID=A0A6J2XLA9_SITOR|nr:protein yellow-like [Sitophilus oryzae]
MILRVLFISLTLLACVLCSCDILEWTGGSYEFPNEDAEFMAIQNGSYIPQNVIATRGQIYKDDIYVALPRFKPGNPATLAKVAVKSICSDAVLTPFPNWEAQNQNDTDGLHSIVDIFVDIHGVLWALNSGIVNVLTEPIRKCHPKVVAYNLLTGSKIKTVDLSGLVVQGSRLQYLAVDYGTDGKPFVYITDAATRSIIVFNVIENKAYRIVVPKSALGPRRDVLYAALVQKGCGNNILVFTYLSGSRIFSIKTEYLRSGSASGKIEDLGAKDGRIILLGTDGGTAIFYRYEGKPEIYRWDANQGSFLGGELVYSSPSCYLSTQVLPDARRLRMRVLESNFPDYLAGTVGCGAAQRVALMIGST